MVNCGLFKNIQNIESNIYDKESSPEVPHTFTPPILLMNLNFYEKKPYAFGLAIPKIAC